MIKNIDKIELVKDVLTSIGVYENTFDERLIAHLDKAISEFMGNVYFADEYKAMPTELLKSYELLNWGFSQNGQECNKCAKLMHKIEAEFLSSEWDYLISLTPNITAKIEWSKKKMARVPREAMLLENAHNASFNNAELIKKSHKCGCFSCVNMFNAAQVKEWIENDAEKTGLCPYCGIDAVLPDAAGYRVDIAFLRAMHEKWF